MSDYYLDSSALVKRYVAEAGTEWVTGLCAVEAGHNIYTVRISAAEIVAALFRRSRIGSLPRPAAQSAVTRFKIHWRTHYQIVEVTEQVIDRAMALAEIHDLRGYDSIQLAAVLEVSAVRSTLSLPSLAFVSADDRLNTAAGAEQLLVENPTTRP